MFPTTRRITSNPTEADTCRQYVVPKLQAAGWDSEPYSIAEQRSFTDGRIVVAGLKATRQKKKKADYLLRYTPDFTIAVVEAKAEYKLPTDGLQQAKDYAQLLGLKFAYSTNGKGIIEFDFITGKEAEIEQFPTPVELWKRLSSSEGLTEEQGSRLLTPSNTYAAKPPRYYQEIAINRAVTSILQGHNRNLLTMATGTGKTSVAFQICWKLWSSGWNRDGRFGKPRILFLADRNILVDDPKDKDFLPFGDARMKIENGETNKSRQMYFAIYQAISQDERRPGLYKEFGEDFFDLIVIDECHRGSAADDSNWREILDFFKPAYRKEFIQIDDSSRYKRCRVQLHAQGIVLRDEVPGIEIKTKTQQVCRENELLVAEIDAKFGGFGIVSPGLSGAIVSSHYFLFTVDSSLLDVRFLGYYIKTRAFLDQVTAQGSTNYSAIRPYHVLAYTMPLPPIQEQCRIVQRVEQLKNSVSTFSEAQRSVRAESSLLLQATRAKLFQGMAQTGVTSLSEAAILERGKFSHRPRNDPRFFGGSHPWIQIGEIESSGKLIKRWTETLNDDGLAISKKFAKGTLLISIAATIGAVGILQFDCCIPDSIVGVTPKPGWSSTFLYHYLCYVRDHLEQVAPQSAQKNINLQILSGLSTPVATPERQGEVVSYLDTLEEKLQRLEEQQKALRSESDLLLPSILNHAFSGKL